MDRGVGCGTQSQPRAEFSQQGATPQILLGQLWQEATAQGRWCEGRNVHVIVEDTEEHRETR